VDSLSSILWAFAYWFLDYHLRDMEGATTLLGILLESDWAIVSCVLLLMRGLLFVLVAGESFQAGAVMGG